MLALDEFVEEHPQNRNMQTVRVMLAKYANPNYDKELNKLLEK